MIRVLIGILMLGLTLGCGGGDGLDRAAVTGKVTLDGTPIEEGSISFLPAGGTQGPATGGQIQNGQYSIAAAEGPVIGHHRVEIRASRKTGKMITVPMDPSKKVEEVAQVVPKQYNSESTLEKDIAAGENVHDFELVSK